MSDETKQRIKSIIGEANVALETLTVLREVCEAVASTKIHRGRPSLSSNRDRGGDTVPLIGEEKPKLAPPGRGYARRALWRGEEQYARQQEHETCR